VWQDKQKAVVLERLISLDTPIAPHKTGKKNSRRKARIFPLRVAVMPGLLTSRPIDAALTNTIMTINVVVRGIDLDCRNVCYSETAHYSFASDRK
jgi:hypothetical protein